MKIEVKLTNISENVLKFLLKNYKAMNCETTMQEPYDNLDSKLLNIDLRPITRGLKRGSKTNLKI